MAFLLMNQIFFFFIAVFIFTRNVEGKGICEGLRFGLYLGLVLGSVQLATYCYMPVPLTLTLGWVAAGVLKGLGSGIVSEADVQIIIPGVDDSDSGDVAQCRSAVIA